MDQIIVSFIIPIYNAEKYLVNILGKLEKQNNNRIEVILIDDGSTDLSYITCCNYAVRNSNFIVFQQENSGASKARNQGLLLAKGKYVTFLDSDDNISENYVSTICDITQRSDVDIVQLDAYVGSPNEGYKLVENELQEGTISVNEYINYVLAQKTNAPWDKIYKLSTISDESIKFNHEMVMGEDITFTLNVLKHSKKIEVVHKAIYYYLINPDGLCANVSLNYFDDLNKMFIEMKKFIEIKQLDSDVNQIMEQAMFRSIFRAIGLCIKNGYTVQEVKNKLALSLKINDFITVSSNTIQDKVRMFLITKGCYRTIAGIITIKSKK